MKLALLPTPGVPLALARRAGRRLDWDVDVVEDAVDSLSGDVEELLGDAGRARRESGHDVAIALTDAPLRSGTRPLAAAVDRDSKVAVVSVPAFGASRLRPRVIEAIRTLALELADGREAPLVKRRFGEVFSPIHRDGTEYVMPAALGHVRLLSGMVRANRPWRALTGLSRALVAAFATGAYALLTVTIWELSTALDWPRLLGIMVASLLALIGWIVIAHEMWESMSGEMGAKDAALYNAATVLTLVVAALFAYAALFVLLLGVSSLVVEGGVFQRNAGKPADFTAYAKLAWMGASMATVAGALGSGLEDVDEVREAAYGANQQKRDRRQDG